jgi:hypothetical protein
MSAANFTAIKRWFKENREDIPEYQLDRLMQEPAYMLLMAGAFEAGREFQQRNPEAGKFLEFGVQYK